MYLYGCEDERRAVIRLAVGRDGNGMHAFSLLECLITTMNDNQKIINDKKIPTKAVIDLTGGLQRKQPKRKRTPIEGEKSEPVVDMTAGLRLKPAAKKKALVEGERYDEMAPVNIHPLWESLFKKYSIEKDPEYQLVCFEDDSGMEDWLRVISRDTGLVVCPSNGGGKVPKAPVLIEFEDLCYSLTVPFVRVPDTVFAPFVKANKDNLGKIDASRLLAICLRKVRQVDSYELERVQNIALADILRTFSVTPPALTKVIKAIRAVDSKPPSAEVINDYNDDQQSPLVIGTDNVRNLVMQNRPHVVLALRPKRTPKNPLVPILRQCVNRDIPIVLYRKQKFFMRLLELESEEIVACIIDGAPKYADVIQMLLNDLKEETTKKKQQRQIDRSNLSNPRSGEQTVPVQKSTTQTEDAIITEKDSDIMGPPLPGIIQPSSTSTARENDSVRGRSDTMTRTNEDGSSAGLSEVDIEALRLEERIYLLEAMLKNISGRRKTLQKEQEMAVAELREKENRVVRLVGKKKELTLAVGRKRKLQQQMTKLLAKTEQRLQVLTTSVDLSLDELAEFVGSESTASVVRHTNKTPSYSSSSSVQEARHSTVQHRPGHTLHLAGATLDRLKTLWMSKRDPSFRLANFGSVLSSKDKIKAFLRISAMETLAVDKVTNGWRWRRESMWNTCLDARLMITEPWNIDDISGRHQTSEKSERTRNDRIDPYIPLCPYEISGECQDEFCAYQHLQPRSLGRVLPREFLPLPHLLLSLVDEVEEDAQQPDVKSIQREPSKKRPATKSGTRALGDSEEDFILLPEVVLNSSDTAASGFDDYALLPVLEKYSVATKTEKTWLSRKQMEKTTKDNVSFKKLLESGDFYLDEQQEAIFVELEPAKFPDEVLLFLVRLTKLVRLSIHTGRFDVSQAVLTFASDWSEKLEKESTSLGENAAKVSCLIVRILSALERKAFSLETEPTDSVFYVAYRTQEHLAIICCFLEYMLPRIGDESSVTLLRTFTELESAIANIGQIEGDRPLDRISSYFSPLPVKEDARHNMEVNDFLPDYISYMARARQLRKDVLAIKSPSKIVADVIKPSLRWFEHFVERCLLLGQDTKDALLKGVMLISQLMMGAIEAGAMQLKNDSQIEVVRNQILDVWVTVDKLMFSIQKSCAFFPSLEFLLSPIVAANVALGTTLQAYDRVIVRLEKILGGYVPSPLSIISEILWSQLLQLEASLPKRTERVVSTKGVYQLPFDIEELHELLALLITSYGVRPNHVVLANDWNLTSSLMDEPSEDYAKLLQSIHERLVEDNLPPIEFHVSDRKLLNQESRGSSIGVVAPIPHSLLVIGTSISKLVLTRTSLKLLPDQFGVYFSCLEVSYIDSSVG